MRPLIAHVLLLPGFKKYCMSKAESALKVSSAVVIFFLNCTFLGWLTDLTHAENSEIATV